MKTKLQNKYMRFLLICGDYKQYRLLANKRISSLRMIL